MSESKTYSFRAECALDVSALQIECEKAKFFYENYDRIFAETMEEAMKHGIRKEIFNDARTMAGGKAKET